MFSDLCTYCAHLPCNICALQKDSERRGVDEGVVKHDCMPVAECSNPPNKRNFRFYCRSLQWPESKCDAGIDCPELWPTSLCNSQQRVW
jgi:hypothetical protein